MKLIWAALVLLSPFTAVAAEPNDSEKAADAVLTACITAASKGEPVDTTGLMTYFTPDRKGEKLTTIRPLPFVQLFLDNKGTFRCTLMGKQEVAISDFAVAIEEQIDSWPRFEHKPLKSLETAYIARGDVQQGLHDVLVTIEVTEVKVWEVMIWDGGPLKAKAGGR